MRNYVKVAYCRAVFVTYDQEGTLISAVNFDVCGIDDEDCDRQVENIFFIKQQQLQGGPLRCEISNDEIEDRYIELNKENLVKILGVARAEQGIDLTTGYNKTWFEIGGQSEALWGETGLQSANWMVEDSPRDTWSHGV